MRLLFVIVVRRETRNEVDTDRNVTNRRVSREKGEGGCISRVDDDCQLLEYTMCGKDPISGSLCFG